MKPFFYSALMLTGYSINAQTHLYTILQVNQAEQLQANAGADIVSSGTQTFIGGSPTAIGGTAPFTYSWSPQDNLSDPTVANPVITPTQEIEYTVNITDSKGCTASDGIQIKISSTQIIQDEDIVFFPNPASERVTIRSNNAKQLIEKIQILDITGKLIQDHGNYSKSSEYILDVSELSAGKYFVCIDFLDSKNYLPLIIER